MLKQGENHRPILHSMQQYTRSPSTLSPVFVNFVIWKKRVFSFKPPQYPRAPLFKPEKKEGDRTGDGKSSICFLLPSVRQINSSKNSWHHMPHSLYFYHGYGKSVYVVYELIYIHTANGLLDNAKLSQITLKVWLLLGAFKASVFVCED